MISGIIITPMDTLWEDIRQKITTLSDGNAFEEYAVYSLSGPIPGLTPVSGGGDFGRDGEAPEANKGAVLTCTIQANVIGNMTKSLKQYKKSDGKATTVYVATSQKLSNTQKQNLRNRAKELGFTLPAIYDEEYFVNALYKDPVWRQKLLRISGELPALSHIPMNARVALDIPMVGRDEEIAKLDTLDGDFLITGQPGSGKTYVATKYAERHNGLFVISDDVTKIADDLRQKTPDVLLIDDIHSKTELLVGIRHLRTQLGLNFRIVGVAWSSGEAIVKTAMGIGDANILHLQELTRDEIVAVIDACGLKEASNLLKREIVDQAKGKPGLAITLSTLCLNGDWEKVFNGDSLYNVVISSFTSRLGQHVTTLLSFIALGGDSGITIPCLSEVSGVSIAEAKAILDELAFGGVISSKDDGTVRIEPESLRFPLVRELFVSGTGALRFVDYIGKYAVANDVIETLLVTVLKGAAMDSSRLTPYLKSDFAAKTWVYYAALGKEEAEYVAANNVGAIVAVPQPLLHRVPEVAIRALMVAAVDDHRPLNQYPNHPARVLHDWAEGAKPGSNNEAIIRREALLRVADVLLNEGYQDELMIGRAIASALNPHYQENEADPGVGKTITFIQGYLSLEEFDQMFALLGEAKRVYEKLSSDEAFAEILSIADDWVYGRQNVSQEYLALIDNKKKELAQTLLTDLKSVTEGHHLIQRRIKQFGKIVGLDLDIEVPREYEVIFPYESRSFKREEARFKKQMEELEKLTAEWIKEDPRRVVEKIAHLQQEANETRTSHPNYLHYMPSILARLLPTTELIEWANLFVSRTSNAMFTSGLADQICRAKPIGYRECLKAMLESHAHSIGAMQAIVVHMAVSEEPELFELAKPFMDQHSNAVEVACLRGEVPVENILYILDNVGEDAAIEICGGIAFAYSSDGKEMPEKLRDKWQHAIITHSTFNYNAMDNLKQLLKNHPALVLPWFEDKLNKTFNKNEFWKLHIEDIANGFAGSLSVDERRRLLSSMDSSNGNGLLVKSLVGNNLDLYATLLENDEAKNFHLIPLNIYSGTWAAMAQAALAAGHTVKDIQEDSFPTGVFGWTGSEYKMWQDRLSTVKGHMEKTEDDSVKKMLDMFIEHIEKRAAAAKARERQEEINGI